MSLAPHRLPVRELAPLVERQAVRVEALVNACLDEIGQGDPTLNAFVCVLGDEARACARQADREIAAGRYRGPLHGIPISIKDLIDVAGTATTAASRVRAGHRATEDAPVVAGLRAAGAIVVGKTNLHEFAFGVTNEDSAFGPTRNPFDHSRSPGGSSGGSAAAVAAGMCVASVGTDTGGSIRIPAAACGVVGLKPHAGAVSRSGVVPLSPTMDHVGPITRCVGDARLMIAAMTGTAWSASRPLRGPIHLGLPRSYFLDQLDADVRTGFEETVERLKDARCVIDEVEIPHAGDLASAYLHISLAEAAVYHAEALDRMPEAYTHPVRVRLELGRYVLAEDYLRALRGRVVLTHEVNAALAGRNGLLLPTLPIPAPPLGASSVRVDSGAQPVRALLLRLTQLFNMTGHPAISIPCGVTPTGLPCGCQLIGPAHDTPQLLDVAETLEPYIAVGPDRPEGT